jgi:hypothetical protein
MYEKQSLDNIELVLEITQIYINQDVSLNDGSQITEDSGYLVKQKNKK